MDAGTENIGGFAKKLWSQLDGKVFYVTSALTLIVSALLLLEAIPTEIYRAPAKTLVGLLLYPVIAFVILVRLRQLPLSSTPLSTIMRAALLVQLNIVLLIFI